MLLLHPFARAAADFAAARALFSSPPDSRVLVALSGGPDSCALLLALHEARDAGALPIFLAGAAHFHHGLRGREADDDAAFSAALCAARLGLPCVIGIGAVDAGSSAVSPNDAARRARYAFLAEAAAADLDADTIATAHTADDQAETILGRVFRGTGTDGLAGIPARRELHPGVFVVRPLLSQTRAEVEEYCRYRGVTPRHDPSNDSERYARSRLRRRLPGLAQDFNPRLREALVRLGENAETDAHLLNRLSEALWTRAVHSVAPRLVRLDTLALRHEHPALRRRVLLRALRHAAAQGDGSDSENAAAGENAATAEAVAAIESLLTAPGSPATDLPGGLRAEIMTSKGTAGTLLCLAAPVPWDVPAPYCLPLPVPGRVRVRPAALHLRATAPGDFPVPAAPPRCRRALTIDIACGTMAGGPGEGTGILTVRSSRPGDRIAPLGMHGRTRLVRDLMADAGWPAAERAVSPLIVRPDTGEALWIVGLAQAESTRVTPETRQIIRLRAELDC